MNNDVILRFKKGIGKKSGKAYYCAYVDLGYRTVALTFDRYIIAELLGVPVAELDEFVEVEPP